MSDASEAVGLRRLVSFPWWFFQRSESTWFELARMYAGRAGLKDMARWERKFVGQIHNRDDQTHALNQLILYVGAGDPNLRLLTNQEVMALDAKTPIRISDWKERTRDHAYAQL